MKTLFELCNELNYLRNSLEHTTIYRNRFDKNASTRQKIYYLENKLNWF